MLKLEDSLALVFTFALVLLMDYILFGVIR